MPPLAIGTAATTAAAGTERGTGGLISFTTMGAVVTAAGGITTVGCSAFIS